MRLDLFPLRQQNVPAKALNRDEFVQDLTDRKVNYRTKEVKQTLFPVGCMTPGTVYHRGVMQYFELAWYAHLGVVLSPDIIWQTLMTEICTIVREDPEKYRHLFSETQEKQSISCQGIPVPGSIEAWIDSVMSHLRQLVPTDIELFIPEFTTTDQGAMICRYATFMDIVSPYYEYSMYLCGIPFIEWLGTAEDWQKICGLWEQLSSLFPDEKEYFNQVFSVIGRLNEESAGLGQEELPDDQRYPINLDYFKTMIHFKRCGSGSQIEAEGWYTKLFRKIPTIRYPGNYPTGLARINFRDLSEEKDYQTVHGLLSSSIDVDLLRPTFGYVLFRKEEAPTPTEIRTNIPETVRV